MTTPAPVTLAAAAQLEAAVSPQRFASYRDECGGDLVKATELYRWNGELDGACWQTLGPVEVVLCNALADRMQSRHLRRGGTGSWLDNPGGVLDPHGETRSCDCTTSATASSANSGCGTSPVADRLADCLLLTGHLDPVVRDGIATTGTVAAVRERRP